jgi:hypothetical protein
MDKYPLPDYAVSMWVVGDSIMIAFPGTVSEQGHTIKLPASEGGLRAAISIMKDRAVAQNLRIGNAGTPTQHDIERQAGKAWGAVSRRLREAKEAMIAERNERKLAEHTAKVRRAEREAKEAREFLKELGL